MSYLPHGGSDRIRELTEFVMRGANNVFQEMVFASKHILLPEAVVPKGMQVVKGLVPQLWDAPGSDMAGRRQVVGGPDEFLVGEELPQRVVVGTAQV